MSDGSAILVFARGPRVESRLKLLGRGDRGTGASAATLLLEHSLAVARGSGADTIVAGDDEEIARSRPAGVRLLLQRGTGFGERLRNAVADTFALGYRRVVVIGTDTPALSPVLCDAALKALAVGSSRTVVLGPSRDGGYYLIGFNAFIERAFAGIPWKTRHVLARTKQALSDCRLISLRTLTDADDEGSLVRALGETRMGGSIAALRRVLDRTRLVRCPSLFETKLVTLAAALIPVRRGPPLPSVAS